MEISCVVQDSLTSGTTAHVCVLPQYACPTKQLIIPAFINGENAGYARLKTTGDVEIVPNRTGGYNGFHLTYLV